MSRLVIFAIVLTAAGPAAAAVYHESGDAGALPGLAQDVLPAGTLDAIEGSIADTFDADLFRIQIDDPAAFSARAKVVAGMAPSVQLFVFDHFGRGVVAALADDNSLAFSLPQIPSGTLQGQPAGTYLLGVSPAGSDPLAPSGESIFPDIASGLGSGLSEPSGLLRFARLFDWTRDYTAIGGSYAIELTGASAISPPSVVPGDFDGDGDVDGADFVIWQTNFPTATGATLATGDADGDGDVDGADFVVWQTNFPFTPNSGVTTVPEPATCWLALLGAVAMMAARRTV